MAKIPKPDRSNRHLIVPLIWKRLGVEAAAAHDMTATMGMLQDDLRTGRAPQAGLMAGKFLADNLLDQWLVARWQGRSDRDALLAQAFAYAYWGQELMLTHRRIAGWGDNIRDDSFHSSLIWQGLAVASGQAWFTDWMAPQLHNLFASGGVAEWNYFFNVDRPALAFFQALQRTLLTGQWPADLSGMGDFAPLYATAGDAEAFATALVDYCDYRSAECLGYHGIDATKRRPPSKTESVMDQLGIDQVLPVELFVLRHAYAKATGRTLSLDAPHPLLQTPLMRLPFPTWSNLHEDATTQALKGLCASAFGRDWSPRQPIAPRFV